MGCIGMQNAMKLVIFQVKTDATKHNTKKPGSNGFHNKITRTLHTSQIPVPATICPVAKWKVHQILFTCYQKTSVNTNKVINM